LVVPSITTNVNSNVVLTTADEFAVGALVGEASWGDMSTSYTFSNYRKVVETFKSGTLVDGAKQFFNGGGKTLKVVRVTPTDTAPTKSDETFVSGTTDVITITAKYAGSYGDNISVTITENGSNRDVVITDGTTTETYENLATNTEIVEAINSGSELVDASEDAATPLVDAITATFLSGGGDGSVVTDDYLAEIQTGGSMWLQDFDYLVIPGKTDNAFHSSIQAVMDSRATDENKFSIYVTGVDKFEAIATTVARTATNSDGRIVVCHSALYGGSGDIEDTNNWMDASYTACAYAGKLCSLAVNSSPTNKTVAFTAGKSLSERFYTSAERKTLADAGFTVFDRLFNNQYGVVIAVTRNGDDSQWQYMLDSRRKVDFILSDVVNVEQQYIGQPNDDFTRKSIRSGASSVLVGARNDRIIDQFNVEVLEGDDPRAVDINITVGLVFEVDFINVNLTLNI